MSTLETVKNQFLEINMDTLEIVKNNLSEVIQYGVNAKNLVDEIKAGAEEISFVYKAGKFIISLPTRIYMNKYAQLCQGVIGSITPEEGQKWLKRIGKEKFSNESYILLNVLNSIEEDEKILFITKVFKALVKDDLTFDEYRRLIIYISKTIYSDLKYMVDNITYDKIYFSEELNGLVCNGWLIRMSNGNQESHKDSSDLYYYGKIAHKFCEIVK